MEGGERVVEAIDVIALKTTQCRCPAAFYNTEAGGYPMQEKMDELDKRGQPLWQCLHVTHIGAIPHQFYPTLVPSHIGVVVRLCYPTLMLPHSEVIPSIPELFDSHCNPGFTHPASERGWVVETLGAEVEDQVTILGG